MTSRARDYVAEYVAVLSPEKREAMSERITIERRVEWEAGREYVWWTVRDRAIGYLKDCRSEEEAEAHAAELRSREDSHGDD